MCLHAGSAFLFFSLSLNLARPGRTPQSKSQRARPLAVSSLTCFVRAESIGFLFKVIWNFVSCDHIK